MCSDLARILADRLEKLDLGPDGLGTDQFDSSASQAHVASFHLNL
jgi:hypothetical protein